MSYLERARKASETVSNALSGLPELNEARLILSPLEVGSAYLDYLQIVYDLVNLNEESLSLIRQANALSRQRGVSSNSASRGGADYFLDTLGQDRRQSLLEAIISASSEIQDDFKTGLLDLATRMTAGHDLASRGVQTSDGASAEVDFAIWGHTKGLSREAMIHFVLCHFLERVFTAHFQSDPSPEVREMVSSKDTLLSAIGDVIKLRHAQGNADSHIVELWAKGRKEGGLQWNKQDRQVIFDEVVTLSEPPRI